MQTEGDKTQKFPLLDVLAIMWHRGPHAHRSIVGYPAYYQGQERDLVLHRESRSRDRRMIKDQRSTGSKGPSVRPSLRTYIRLQSQTFVFSFALRVLSPFLLPTLDIVNLFLQPIPLIDESLSRSSENLSIIQRLLLRRTGQLD